MGSPASPGSGQDRSGSRLAEFESEVSRLKVRSGGAGPERRLATTGAAAAIVGLVIALVAFSGSGGAADPRDQTDFVILAIVGLGLTIVGTAVWFRYSLARYLRYWLIRLIYEQRHEGDRLLDTLSGSSATVDVRDSGAERPARSRSE